MMLCSCGSEIAESGWLGQNLACLEVLGSVHAMASSWGDIRADPIHGRYVIVSISSS